jgi:hypothetical protein
LVLAYNLGRPETFLSGPAILADGLARLLVHIGPIGDGPWRLTMDRTHWQLGKADIN